VGHDFNRWLIVPAATLNHLSLGSIYAWSIFNVPLMRLNGVVVQASSDWSLGDITPTFSLVMGGFASGAILGRYLESYGPRVSCLAGATCLAGGFSLASAAVVTQNLPMLYLGGAVWGLANGWAYVPPISTLIKFFPEKKGMASGMCLLGYGGGAMVAAPLFSRLIEHFRVMPEYIGPATSDFDFVDGKLMAETAEGLREVVVATAADLASCGIANAEPGAYLVGTGSTGIAETFLTLGLGYGALMAAMSFVFRLPPDNYVPPGVANALTAETEPLSAAKPREPAATPLTTHNVSVTDATRSRQFWLLYAGFGSSIIGCYGLLSSGKLMMTEAFGSALPDMVTAGFTSTFVAGMSAANLSGRIFFPTVSDYLARWRGGDPFFARKYVQSAMWGASPLMYLGIVWSIHRCVEQPSVLPLAVFSGCTLGILSVFGGSTANRPAMIGDLFGLKSLGVITARQLSVVLPSAFLGPRIVAYYRDQSTVEAISDLSTKIDDETFHHAFGATKDALPTLIDSKAVTITRLLDLIPKELAVQDPTPFLYDKSMYIMAGCQIVALASNFALRPMDSLTSPLGADADVDAKPAAPARAA